MKRFLIAVMAAMTLVLFAPQIRAEQTTAAKTTPADSHYRWQDNHWWYWMPDGKWMVWNGSSWISYEDFAKSASVRTVSQAEPAAGPLSSDTPAENANAQAAAPARSYCPPTYTGGGGGSYAGYGWSWGPGTALRNGPGGRF